MKAAAWTLEAVVVLRSAILKKLFIGLHVNQMRVSKAISCRRLTENGPGQIGRCVDGVRSRLMERETFVEICDCSRWAHAFVGRVDGCKLGSQAVRKTLERSISRAERMALVLRISRFIGTAMKPRRARLACTLSSYLCAGLCIFRLSRSLIISRKLFLCNITQSMRLLLTCKTTPICALKPADRTNLGFCNGIVATCLAPLRTRYLTRAGCFTQGLICETALYLTEACFEELLAHHAASKTPSSASSAQPFESRMHLLDA